MVAQEDKDLEEGKMPLLDHLIEEKQGRPVPPQELERVKAHIARELRRISLAR